MSKAYDTLNLRILFDKLDSYGVSETAGRRQQVLIRNKNLIKLSIKDGVPQRSVLRPIIFIVYLNNITEISKSYRDWCQITNYVEDTSILISDKNMLNITEKTQKCNGGGK